MVKLEEKTETKIEPFDYLNSITKTKKNMMRGSENDKLAEELYNKWFVNWGLSMSYDTILLANMMNLHHKVPNRAQYEFYMATCPKKRYITWAKKPRKDEDVLMIQKYYNCNEKVAREYLKLLTPEQLSDMEKQVYNGGPVGISSGE